MAGYQWLATRRREIGGDDDDGVVVDVMVVVLVEVRVVDSTSREGCSEAAPGLKGPEKARPPSGIGARPRIAGIRRSAKDGSDS